MMISVSTGCVKFGDTVRKFKGTGIFLSQQQSQSIRQIWYLDVQTNMFTETAYAKGDTDLMTYVESCVYSKFIYAIWLFAINGGFTDKSKSLYLSIFTTEIMYEI